MLEHTQIGRIVHAHDWSSPQEWAFAVEALADLSDAEIERLTEETARLFRS
ncbi:MAG: hypothetical protein GX886_15030 [Comamonadaceae bacterium]|nr:hypothetical protein [Comamonadaceae bacterium]